MVISVSLPPAGGFAEALSRLALGWDKLTGCSGAEQWELAVGCLAWLLPGCSSGTPGSGLHHILLSFVFLLLVCEQAVKTGPGSAAGLGAQSCYLYCLDSVV